MAIQAMSNAEIIEATKNRNKTLRQILDCMSAECWYFGMEKEFDALEKIYVVIERLNERIMDECDKNPDIAS